MLSLWRKAHLALALIASLFLIVLSLTGVVLAVDAAHQKTQNYKSKDFNKLNLAEVISELYAKYPEITDLNIDYNQFVSIQGQDENGKTLNHYIDPTNGKILAEVVKPSSFIQWNIALHRSLFLKDTGRILVGICSFLLLIITFSGVILIAKRQQGFRHFFDPLKKDILSQYYHVFTGRIFLLPIILLSLTGTLLLFVRLGWISQKSQYQAPIYTIVPNQKSYHEFKIFRDTQLKQVQKIEFPFIAEDPEDYFIIKLKDKELQVNAATGIVEKETKYPLSQLVEKVSLDWHAGRTSAILALILGLASINILFFIYSGTVIFLRRTQTKIKNKFSVNQAEIVILVGSENGSTFNFADKLHQQLLALGKKSYLAEMNKMQNFPQLTHLFVFTSTYGLGTAPSNAHHFENLLGKCFFTHPVSFAVLGFGSKSYPDFGAFAQFTHNLLLTKENLSPLLALQTVNDRSTEEVAKWMQKLATLTAWELSTTPASYTPEIAKKALFKVIEKTLISTDNHTFKIVLSPFKNTKFSSGDLLAIYPKNDGRERQYSIGKIENKIQLLVKKYPGGLGSEFLYNLKIGAELEAKIIKNPDFHFPKKTKSIAMISNGTGIAPFLGMIAQNKTKIKIRLYAGFRNNNNLTTYYRDFLDHQLQNWKLASIKFAFSRENEKQYVMDLIVKDQKYFSNLLNTGGIIMICGSLQMQRDVEKILSKLLLDKPYETYAKQIISDCY